ncbi:MAG: AAA family ATPase [Planctomycetota bacterium]|nr:MAG: AAA family ATPase [Planctomycetota bacterium]KAB2949006.1 MAG: AAA family ATPase [Phycisphaerae bacterium]MCQ3919393.1 ATPase [Planctomycetota bacterium]
MRDPTIAVLLDLVTHLREDRTLRLLRNLIRKCQSSDLQLVLIDHREDVPAVLLDWATRFEVSLPDAEEIERLLKEALAEERRDGAIQIDIRRSDLENIVSNLRGLTRRQVRMLVREAVCCDRRFDQQDAANLLLRKRQSLQSAGLLEFVDRPLDLSEIGGLRRLKSWLKQREDTWSRRAIEFGLTPPRGILLLGVQGAGKSLCAKAIATAWRRPLLRMDVGALYDKYIGESERRLRDALRQAEMMAPVVLWIDEIEKAFASAASQSTDGGLSRRMFATLLTWMQEHRAPAFLVATANDIAALPPELLRKGRFDEIFFVDLPKAPTRMDIFEIHLRKRLRDPAAFDLPALAKATEGYSGAEIEQAVLAGLHQAFDAGEELTTERLLKAAEASPPLSVTMAEQVEALRAWAKGRCVPAD